MIAQGELSCTASSHFKQISIDLDAKERFKGKRMSAIPFDLQNYLLDLPPCEIELVEENEQLLLRIRNVAAGIGTVLNWKEVTEGCSTLLDFNERLIQWISRLEEKPQLKTLTNQIKETTLLQINEILSLSEMAIVETTQAIAYAKHHNQVAGGSPSKETPQKPPTPYKLIFKNNEFLLTILQSRKTELEKSNKQHLDIISKMGRTLESLTLTFKKTLAPARSLADLIHGYSQEALDMLPES